MIQKLIDSFRKKGLKITPQRLAIFRILKDNKSHPSAEEIYQRVRKDYRTLSLATVYQTLETLEQIGGIRILRFDRRKTRYDPDLSPHHHLICTRCQKITDLHDDYSETVRLPPSLTNRFQINGFNVVFYGICGECRKKRKSQKRKAK